MVCACKSDPENFSTNIVNVRLAGEPDQFNPILTSGGIYKQVEWQLFMPLLQFDSETLELSPVLAVSRPRVEAIVSGEYTGGSQYIFEIREEARWDDGKTVSAEDFVFTLKIFLHPDIGHPGLRSFLSFIKKIEPEPSNPKRFTVITNSTLNIAEEVIGTMAIYPKHIYDPQNILDKYSFEVFTNNQLVTEKVEQDSALLVFSERFKKSGHATTLEQINGCGPYKIDSWTPGQRVVLKKKNSWWGAGTEGSHHSFGNNPEQIIYHFVEDDVILGTLMKAQEIDVAASIDPETFNALQESKIMQEAYNFFTPISSTYYFISFNTKKTKLSDKKTRRAISHLVNMEEVIKITMNGYGAPVTGPILPVKSYYNKKLLPIEFNIEKAKTLLSEAGWEDHNQDGILDRELDGSRVDFLIKYKYTNNNPIAENVGFLLKNNAIKAGIEVELVPLEFNKLIEDTRSRDFELYCSRWSQMPGLDDLRGIWHTESDTPRGFNKTGFGNTKTDALIDSINFVLDEKKRTSLYHEIQEIIYNEQPYIFLFVPKERIAIHKRFQAKGSALRPGYFENTFRLKE